MDRILDTWEKKSPHGLQSTHPSPAVQDDDLDQVGVAHGERTSVGKEIRVVFRRHAALILRDPILYLGRTVAFLVMNTFFGLVYWNSRPFEQERVFDKLWVNIWYSAVATNCK